MSVKWAASAAAGSFLCLAGVPADAHHSIQAVVDTSKTVQSELILTKVDWVNPHMWFHFTLANDTGAGAKDVMIEWMSLAGMRQAGFSGPEVFTVGRTFMVTYYPNRDGTMGGNMVNLVDETTGRLFNRQGPQAPPPPVPQLRPKVSTTNIRY